jgi:ribonucleoside-diphosphate reductase alpha chain
MRVLKRSGEYEDVSFDKVLNRIKILSKKLSVDIYDVGQKVCSRIYDGVKTSELDELAAHICSSMIIDNPDYGVLASRIIISNHHKNTSPSFSETINTLYNNTVDGERCSLISDVLYNITMKNKEKLNSYICYERDYTFDYFGFKTLERSYLIKVDNKVIERPQHLFMRVSLGIHSDDLKEALNTYDCMSKKYFTHATPTLFNAGTITPQNSSCFVAGTMIYTSKGCKPIEQVEIGDEVITHLGRYKKVVQKHINSIGDRQLFDFKVFNTPTITATDNHEFMSISSEQTEWGMKPKWNRLDALRVGDYIEIPNFKGSNDSPIIDLKEVVKDILGDGDNVRYEYKFDDENKKIIPYSLWSCQRTTKKSGVITVNFKKEISSLNQIWTIDEHFCKFLGVWYGDGHVIQDRNSKRNQVPKGIGFTLHKENQNLAEFLIKYGEQIFGIRSSIHDVKKQNVTQVLFHSTILGHIFTKLFGKYFNNKKLYTDINYWNNNYIEALLSGLITSDGFVTKDGYVRVAMCNPKFVRDVYNLCRSRGFVVSYIEANSIYITKDGEERPCKTAYMTVPKQHSYMKYINKTYKDNRLEKFQDKITISSHTKIIDGRTFLRIDYKKPSLKTDTTVYTFGVEDDHSYMVDGIIAKNCFLKAMPADSLDGIFDAIKDCARISKYAGGIGIHVHNIRAKGSRIRSTNGTSDGLVPMLKVFNHVGRYINQCFTPDTLIFSEDGIIEISKVKIGDQLITYDSETRSAISKPVLSVSKNNIDADILEIRTSVGVNTVKVTKEHELFVKKENQDAKFIPANELAIGDQMGYPEMNGMFWFDISDIKTIHYTGDVYDLNMLDNHNYTVVDLGLVHNSGKRNGSIAIYLEPWHADVEQFLDLKKNHGNEEDRARDLFYALWIPDLFMERIKENKIWSLMCPDKCKNLSDVYGQEFNELYEKYESEGKFIKQMPAQELWFKILESQIETGTPYLLYKDACNAKSNQKNLGTIKSSNLCVAEDTMILTSKGYYPIKDLNNKTIQVWNGDEFSETTVMKTGENQKLINIEFNNGQTIKCTPYHKFYIEIDQEVKVFEAKDLLPDMKIINCNYPIIKDLQDTIYNPYMQGLFASSDDNTTLFDVVKPKLFDKCFVPINYSIETKINWLKGYLDNVKDIDPKLLKNIILMLNTLGINSLNQVSKLTDLGFTTYRTDLQDTIQDICVKTINDTDELGDTYCFNEPKQHKGIFNGILTGNCTEIIQYSDATETSVCNLASICLPTYIIDKTFDFNKLHEITMVITKNLNKIIDINFYPIESGKKSNFRHRPIGIGIQGLADTYILMGYPFDSPEAFELNKQIFETIYHAACEASMLISKKRHEFIQELKDSDINSTTILKYINPNTYETLDSILSSKYPGAYQTFEGSPASNGQLQFDLWNHKVNNTRYDWDELKQNIMKYGMRNSLLLAPMPTASTSQIMGFTESFECITSNIYKRKTLAGEFVLVNKYLINDLIKLNLWNKDMKNKIMLGEGSIQHITEIPDNIRALYKTVWELSQKVVIDQSADRGPFICQSQSLNLFLEPSMTNFQSLTSMHMYAHSKGLKTGCYYLRTKPQAKTQQFTIEPTLKKTEKKQIVCTDEVCTMCSS